MLANEKNQDNEEQDTIESVHKVDTDAKQIDNVEHCDIAATEGMYNMG